MDRKVKNKIVIGTWPLSGDYGTVKISEIEKVLKKCYLNKFYEYDTAPSYGNSFIEGCLGNIFSGEKKIKINTKVGNIPFLGKSFEIDDMKRSVYHSLERLRINKINILFLHNPRKEINDKFKKIFKFLEDLKSQKIISYHGLSCAPNYEYEKKFLNFFDFIQDDINLLKITKIKSNNIYARSIFANGILTGAIKNNKKFDKQDHRSGWLNDFERRSSINKRIKILKSSLNNDLKQQSLNYVLSKKEVHKAIFGVKKIKHVDSLERMINKFTNNQTNFKKIERLIDKNFYLSDKHKTLGF
jgi:aryl-alcohol dehydrogenase-like predicted oxidoreductase